MASGRRNMAWVKLLKMLSSARKGSFVPTKAIKRRMGFEGSHSISVALAQLHNRKGAVIERKRDGRIITGYRIRNLPQMRKVVREASAR